MERPKKPAIEARTPQKNFQGSRFRQMLKTLALANYRSILKLVAPLGPLNVITGPNGSGKSNLYRALRLLGETAQGGTRSAIP